MKKVPTWRVILGSIVLTTGIVASHSMRFGGVESAEAAPAAHGSGAGSGGGSAMGSGAGSGAGSASHAHKPVKHATESPGPDDIHNGDTTNPGTPDPNAPVTPPPSSGPRNPTPVPPGSPGPTGPITPGTAPVQP